MKMKQDLEIIKDLMDELITDMEPGESDFSERLGRNKPKIAAVKMEIDSSGNSVGDEEKERLEGSMEDDLEDPSIFEVGADPGEILKNRLQRMRSKKA